MENSSKQNKKKNNIKNIDYLFECAIPNYSEDYTKANVTNNNSQNKYSQINGEDKKNTLSSKVSKNENNNKTNHYNKYKKDQSNFYVNRNSNSYKPMHKQNNHKNISMIINQKENLRSYLQENRLELPEQTSRLINELIECSIECMICNENISSLSEIWECDTCFTIYHNSCIYDWIFKLNTSTNNKNEVTEISIIDLI